MRNDHNTPLWLGDTGENSNPWYYETRQLAEQHEIGWNWWTHKKLETTRAPLSSSSNEDYEKVVNYWKGNGPQPTTEEARRGLFQMAEDLAIEKNTLRPDLIASLFSNQFGTTNKPYTKTKRDEKKAQFNNICNVSLCNLSYMHLCYRISIRRSKLVL